MIKLAKSNADTQGLTIRNAKSNANKLVIPKYPLDQIACKLESEIVEVKLEKIESSTTGLNNVTYQGILDRGYRTESGAIVSKINLHNPSSAAESKREGPSGIVMAPAPPPRTAVGSRAASSECAHGGATPGGARWRLDTCVHLMRGIREPHATH